MCVCLFLLFVFLFVVSDVLFPNESDYFWLNVDTAHANQEIIWILGMMSFSAREAFCAMRMADTRTHKSSNLMLGIGIIWSWGLFPVMTSLFKFHSSSSYVPFSSWFCPKMAGSYQTWWVPDSNFGWFPNLMTSFSEISGLHFLGTVPQHQAQTLSILFLLDIGLIVTHCLVVFQYLPGFKIFLIQLFLVVP